MFGEAFAARFFAPEVQSRLLELQGLTPTVKNGLRRSICKGATEAKNYALAARACEGAAPEWFDELTIEQYRILSGARSGEATSADRSRSEFRKIVGLIKRGAKAGPQIYCGLASAGADLDRDSALWLVSNKGLALEQDCATTWVKLGELAQAVAWLNEMQREFASGVGVDVNMEIQSVAEVAVERHLDSRLWLQLERAPLAIKAGLAVEMALASKGRRFLTEAREAVALVQDFDVWSRLMGRLGSAWVKTRPAWEAMAMTAQCRPSDRIETLTAVLEKVASPSSDERIR